MFRFLTFIILLILIQRFIKTLQEQQKRQQQEPTEEEIKRYFQTLGFPPPEEIPATPKPEQLEKPAFIKKEIKKVQVQVPELKPTEIETQVKQVRVEEYKEELITFSEDKLEEGIILSEILGPPKAYRPCRSGEIGRRA